MKANAQDAADAAKNTVGAHKWVYVVESSLN
jgi:hypothetical protein